MECHCRLNACLSSAPSEGEKEREKIRERRGRREGKIRDPFVLGDMRMPEKEGTIVEEWTDRGRGARAGRWTVGGRREGKGVFGLVGCQEGVKYQSVVVLCQSTVGPPDQPSICF